MNAPHRPGSGPRRALRETFAINLRTLSPIAAAITALPVVALFGIGLAAHDSLAAIFTGMGANLVAIVSLVGAPRLPLRLALYDAIGLGLCVFIGTLTSSTPWVHIALLVPLSFLAGMAVLFGNTQAVMGTQTLVAFLVLGRFSGSFVHALHLGVLVCLGALVEVIALLILRLPPTLRYQRAAVAVALGELGQYARTPAEQSAFGVLERIDDAQRVLSPLSLLGRSDDRDLRAVVDQARRARLEFTTLAGLRTRLADIDDGFSATVNRALEQVAPGLAELAETVRWPRRANDWRGHAHQLRDIVTELRQQVDGLDEGELSTLMNLILAELEALAGQLRSIGHLIEREGEDLVRGAWRVDLHWRKFSLDPFIEGWGLVRDNLSWRSSALRHAVRMCVAVVVAAVAAQVLDLPRGYWVPYAVALILKPDYSTLLRRGVGRVAGTMAGAVVAALLIAEWHPGALGSTILVGLLSWAAYTAWTANFSLSNTFITALILVFLSVASANSLGTALDRLLDVSLGAVIALAAYLVWPSSPTSDVRQRQHQMFSALAVYLDWVMRETLQVGHLHRRRMSAASRDAHFRYADAEAAVGRALEEPSSTRSDPEVERVLISSGLRILRATHALRFEAERGVTTANTDALQRLRDVLVSSLRELAQPEPRNQELSPRRAYLAALQDLDAGAAPASIALNLDEIVNAVNTASQLIDAEIAEKGGATA